MLDCRFRRRLPEFDLEVGLSIGVETLALVGRSGSGKSTTLNVIAGLTQPDSGGVSLAGRRLVDVGARVWTPPETRGIGYLFQHYALFPHLSAFENVAYGLFRLGKDERAARVRRTLDFLDLRGIDRARPWELSGGERQRVALARALVTEPSALLLDEPLAALDVESRSRIRLELRDLLRRLHIPTIVVSHDFDDARVLGDRIAAMDRGRIVQAATAAQMTAHPADAFVAALTGTNLAPSNGRIAAFDPWVVTLSAEPRGATYEWRGAIVDVRPLGAHVRVALRGEVEIRADLDAAEAARAGYHVGDVVFASIPDAAARFAPSPSS